MSNQMKKDLVRFLYVISTNRLAHSLMMAMYSVFLLQKGLTLFEVSLMNIIFHIAIPVLEIPTGAVADVLGRKRSYLLAVAIDCLGLGLYAIGSDFAGFALAEFVLAVSYAFKSGSVDAHLWETITVHAEEEGMSEDEMTSNNRTASIMKEAAYRLSGAIGGSLGPVIATFGLSAPWAASSVLAGVSGVVAYRMLPADEASTNKSRTKAWHDYTNVMKHGISRVIGNRSLRSLTVVSALSGFAIIPIFMYWGPYLEGYSKLGNMFGLSIAWILIEISMFSGILAAKKMSSRLHDRHIAACGLALMGVGSLAMALSNSYILAAIGLVIVEFANGIAVQGLLIAKQCAITRVGVGGVSNVSSIRSTILSVISMVTEVGVCGGLLLGGILSQTTSLKVVFLSSACIMIVTAAIMVASSKKE